MTSAAPSTSTAHETAPIAATNTSSISDRVGTTGGAQNAVDTLLALVKDDLVSVNEAIMAKMQSSVPLIPQLAGHLIGSGGKRLRPLLTLASAQMLDADMARAVSLAACVEFIHTATLLHDDVVDESALRRGKKTANAVWGNQASVLVGDFLFSRSFELMVEDGSLDVLRILSGASSIIAEGEVLQLTTAGNLATTEAQYLDVIAAKTAALFAAACEISAVIKGSSSAEQKALYTYGEALGIAFQIADDVLDYSAHQATLGKTIGDDFREGKMTLPIIHAYQHGTTDEKAFWTRTIEAQKQQDGDLETALAIMAKYGSLDFAMQQARAYGEKAIKALSIFPDNAAKSALEGIITFSIERAY